MRIPGYWNELMLSKVNKEVDGRDPKSMQKNLRDKPQATIMGVRKAYTWNTLQDTLKHLYAAKSLRQIAKQFGVSYGTIHRCLNGIQPKDPEIRKRLGLPQIIQQKVHRNQDGTFRKVGE